VALNLWQVIAAALAAASAPLATLAIARPLSAEAEGASRDAAVVAPNLLGGQVR
jgi:hypothetical protein